MSDYRPGHSLRLTDDGRRVTIWSAAPGVGRYWAHLGETVVLIRVRVMRDADLPVVTLVEE